MSNLQYFRTTALDPEKTKQTKIHTHTHTKNPNKTKQKLTKAKTKTTTTLPPNLPSPAKLEVILLVVH